MENIDDYAKKLIKDYSFINIFQKIIRKKDIVPLGALNQI